MPARDIRSCYRGGSKIAIKVLLQFPVSLRTILQYALYFIDCLELLESTMIEDVLLRAHNDSAGQFVIADCLVQDDDEQRLFFERTPRIMYGFEAETMLNQH